MTRVCSVCVCWGVWVGGTEEEGMGEGELKIKIKHIEEEEKGQEP